MEKVIRVVAKEDPAEDVAYWLSRPAAERISAMELLRRNAYAATGLKSLPRLKKEIRLRSRLERPS